MTSLFRSTNTFPAENSPEPLLEARCRSMLWNWKWLEPLLTLASPFSTSATLLLAWSLAVETFSIFKKKCHNHLQTWLHFAKTWKLPFAFLLLELGVLTIRRPISGLEYSNLRNENRGNSLRGRGVAPLQPPAPLSFSLNILRGAEKYYTLLQSHISRHLSSQWFCKQIKQSHLKTWKFSAHSAWFIRTI